MRLALTLIASCALLAACGGGSGDTPSSPSGSEQGTASAVVLTSSNYVPVARQALASSSYVMGAGNFSSSTQVNKSQPIVRNIEKSAAKLINDSQHSILKSIEASEGCSLGGSISGGLDDRNGNNRMDAGDSYFLRFNQCREDDEITNGELRFTFHSTSGNINTELEPESYPFSLTVTASYANLTTQSNTTRHEGSGSLHLTIQAQSPNERTTVIRTDELRTALTQNGRTTSQVLKNYEGQWSLTPIYETNSVRGTIINSEFDSRTLYVQTPAPFKQDHAQTYPSSGASLITGAAGSQIRVTALDASSVQIELDADGNGSFEIRTVHPWRDLM